MYMWICLKTGSTRSYGLLIENPWSTLGFGSKSMDFLDIHHLEISGVSGSIIHWYADKLRWPKKNGTRNVKTRICLDSAPESCRGPRFLRPIWNLKFVPSRSRLIHAAKIVWATTTNAKSKDNPTTTIPLVSPVRPRFCQGAFRVGLKDGMEDFSPVHCGYETSFDQPDSKKQK